MLWFWSQKDTYHWSSFAKKIFSSYSCIIILLAHFVFDFQGVLHDGVEIAVKRASYDGKIPCSYFENKIKIIPRLQHKYSYASWILHSKVREDLGP